MDNGDTIVGIATAAGQGAVAIVRISGSRAVEFFERVFRSAAYSPPYESHRLMVGKLIEGDQVIDEVMGVVMLAPRSYTREDVCEIHTHGGSVAAALCVKLLVSLGARPAQAGEFTRRAFLNGRMDLAQAEAVMGIIQAQSAVALRAEEAQLMGGQSRFVLDAQRELLDLLSALEAHIDYPEEISQEEALEGLAGGLDGLIKRLSGAIDERSARIVREGLRVALCGRPNAGKSTLFNALLGEERAIVTEVPGTTRDVLHGSFFLDGLCVHVTDTAGLRESEDRVERIGVERAWREVSQADVALLLVDGSRPLDQEEQAMILTPLPCPSAVLLNKEDLSLALEMEEVVTLAAGRPLLRVSAKTGEGLAAVRDYLRGFLQVPQQLLLTHERHMAVAREALDRLIQAREALAGGQPTDFVAVDLHDALYLLGRITGESVDERLLDDIFSRFCVGK
ncbi:MAG: tRNA uridine-5-carboxymethylaminomethyl(34) synthesis GTPase MnmE [Clostridiales bacterium]|nr:tRNA uridine-5-carboxymethylaminomethyl(34) synthesis GTPase MnmE [Clostridiales bacterium]